MPKVSRADREKRLDRTTELLAFHTHDEVVRKLARQFKVHQATAKRWINQVRKRILANIQKPRQEWVADTLHQLNEIIRTDKDRRLEALKQRTCLLGLNAPTQVKLSVEGVYRAPDQWRAFGNAAFLEKAQALAIEYERLRVTANGDQHGNGGAASAGTSRPTAEQLRLFGLPSVPVSPSPPGAPEGGVEFIVPPRSQPIDRGDAGPAW